MKEVLAIVEFQDTDGFPVETSSQQRVRVAPGSEETVTGFELIAASVASTVGKIAAKIEER
jgi:hypothetical protein